MVSLLQFRSPKKAQTSHQRQVHRICSSGGAIECSSWIHQCAVAGSDIEPPVTVLHLCNRASPDQQGMDAVRSPLLQWVDNTWPGPWLPQDYLDTGSQLRAYGGRELGVIKITRQLPKAHLTISVTIEDCVLCLCFAKLEPLKETFQCPQCGGVRNCRSRQSKLRRFRFC